jgi:thiamine-monophosphate kinase
VPLSEAARVLIAAEPGLREPALTGGDDYEIVCTVPPDKAESFKAAAKAAEVPVSEIGVVAEGEGVRFIGSDGEPLTFRHASFSHF